MNTLSIFCFIVNTHHNMFFFGLLSIISKISFLERRWNDDYNEWISKKKNVNHVGNNNRPVVPALHSVVLIPVKEESIIWELNVILNEKTIFNNPMICNTLPILRIVGNISLVECFGLDSGSIPS